MIRVFSIILIIFWSTAKSQIPFEIFAGHERTTVDIMFFKYFKNNQGENSRWLFFNRNRASVDYRMTKTTFLPQFGFTEAISYNHEKLKGFAPVIVGQVLSWGVFPKAGIQYAHISKNMTIFTWLVCETLEKPDLDYFLLFRYTPKITEKVNLFTQVESVNAFPTESMDNFNFTQRIRVGIKHQAYQFGVGADFNQSGNTTFTKIYNVGVFIRNEF
jgi:hypothetical protein